MHIVSGLFVIKPGKRDEFMKAVYDQEIIAKIRAEDGNISYTYYYPYENQDAVYFIEEWEDASKWQAHCSAPHVTGDLKALKDVYLSEFYPGLLGSFEALKK